MIAVKKTLKPERDLLTPDSISFCKIVLGATLIPKPIADFFTDSDSTCSNSSNQFVNAWNTKKCDQCIEEFDKVKGRRLVEQFLFLKYERIPISNLL